MYSAQIGRQFNLILGQTKQTQLRCYYPRASAHIHQGSMPKKTSPTGKYGATFFADGSQMTGHASSELGDSAVPSLGGVARLLLGSGWSMAALRQNPASACAYSLPPYFVLPSGADAISALFCRVVFTEEHWTVLCARLCELDIGLQALREQLRSLCRRDIIGCASG